MSQERDLYSVVSCISLSNEPILFQEENVELLKYIYDNLKNFKSPKECPDAYFIDGETIFLFEHFRFYNGELTDKGSKQACDFSIIDKKIKEAIAKGENINGLKFISNVVKNGNTYEENFSTQFDKHQSKIDTYISTMKKELSRDFKKVHVGFVIEDASELGTYIPNGRLLNLPNGGLLNLLRTTVLKNKFLSSQKLDFIFFAMTHSDANFVSFVTKNVMEKQSDEKLLDVKTIGAFSGQEQTVFVIS